VVTVRLRSLSLSKVEGSEVEPPKAGGEGGKERTFTLTFILSLKGEEIIFLNKQDAPFGQGVSLLTTNHEL
jgi:hypothetical protein